MKKLLKYAILLLGVSAVTQLSHAQDESQTVYNMLRLPVSAHSAAVGSAITLIDDDASTIFDNPALLSCASNRTIGFNYMNYMAGVNMLSAHYNMAIIPRGTLAVSAQYIDYGTMNETSSEGVQTGTFSAKDISLAGYFSYLLTDNLAAGITAKFISSNIADYNSFAMGVDLGLNYYNPENEWSLSAVVRNLGGQIVAYDEEYEALPLDLQVGVSKRLTNTPLRFHATLVDLNHPHYSLGRHLALGADVLLTSTIWVGARYNFRRAFEMKIGSDDDESSHGAGLSLGAGLNLEKFGVNVGYGKYHASGSSVLINLNYKL